MPERNRRTRRPTEPPRPADYVLRRSANGAAASDKIPLRRLLFPKRDRYVRYTDAGVERIRTVTTFQDDLVRGALQRDITAPAAGGLIDKVRTPVDPLAVTTPKVADADELVRAGAATATKTAWWRRAVFFLVCFGTSAGLQYYGRDVLHHDEPSQHQAPPELIPAAEQAIERLALSVPSGEPCTSTRVLVRQRPARRQRRRTGRYGERLRRDRLFTRAARPGWSAQYRRSVAA